MPRSRRMRDMARRRRDMRARRDMRNPYGSRGGYVVSDRRDRNYDMRYSDRYADAEHSGRYDGYNYMQSDYARGGMGSEPNREYDRHYGYPYYMNDYARSSRTGRYIRDMRDYGSGEKYLSDEELMEWKEDLLEEVEPQFKAQFEDNRVVQRAKEMGVKFKDYTEDEYIVTVLMIATDFGKTVGMNNTDQMFRMAVDWLEDDDAELQGSEKLSAYYDEIVCGGE